MNKNKLLYIVILFTCLFTCKKVYAFDVNNYRYRELCGAYEVAGFHSDGYIDPVACKNTYEEARDWMVNNGADDLAIMTWYDGQVKIIDANMALLDLTVFPEAVTYYYENSELTSRKYTYMDNGSLYGGVDGGFIQAGYSNTYGKWTAKVRIGNFTGWIQSEAYEIVPITWLKSYSSYTVTSESIRHNYVSKIQEDYRSSGGNTIGPKPSMLNEGTYFSYDGHYFYSSIDQLIRDYKNNTYEHAVNKDNIYYNYYMYLSNHTRTNYSSVNIDEFIRNNLGYTEDVYGDIASNGTSRLYGMGNYFYYTQEKYGVNAVLSLSLSRNESGNGKSYLAINKNNGFGLDAVDSNPIGGAKWFATYANSIITYASTWVTYGYAHPRDWRYFGPQFGDKWSGMNVKYASDTYWSEKMASKYYELDKVFGLQDYDYYQLGVLKYSASAYSEPSSSSKWIYSYPEAEDAVVIVDEVINNNERWYKVVSDINLDNNYNEIGGYYNWNSYVYVRADDIKLINTAKNGYKTPNSVTEYQNKDYEYDLYVENSEFKPKVGKSTKNTSYYYDSALTSTKGETLLKDRYVMVYSVAYLNNQPVSYLVTSDYFHSQKHWVAADSITLTNDDYGKVTVDLEGNQYTWVNYNTEDAEYSIIGGLYTYAYVPILESVVVGSDTWYKVPVSLTTNSNVYGYTLSKFGESVWIDVTNSIKVEYAPTITANDVTLYEGETFNPMANVTASDLEDGDLTSSIEITSNNVNTAVPGVYEVTYQVVDSSNKITTKTISVTIRENHAPVIVADDKVVTINTEYNPLTGVTAVDDEDGNITNKINVIENNVIIETLGTYTVIYEVIDNYNKKTAKTITVEVVKDQLPVINASNKTIVLNMTFNPMANVTAIDPEDGDISTQIVIIENNLNTTTSGTYEITYEVTDSSDNTVTKTITVEVLGGYIERPGEFVLEELSFNSVSKKFTISGCIIITGENNVNKTYYFVLIDKNTSNTYRIPISRWEENIPYDLGTENGKDYSDSWFKGTINFEGIPNGDYELYMSAYSEQYYTIQKVDNFFGVDITKREEDDNHGYNFKTRYDYIVKPIELEIRDSLYTKSTAPTYKPMVNEYEEISFKNNKLYMSGISYNYGGTYSSQTDITRKLILENTETYAQKIYDLGSKTGLFTITTNDHLDKTYAWYEKEIDLSALEVGTYSLIIYTKTINAEDYGELTDMFAELNETLTINNKEYKITYNKNRQNRVEIIVK